MHPCYEIYKLILCLWTRTKVTRRKHIAHPQVSRLISVHEQLATTWSCSLYQARQREPIANLETRLKILRSEECKFDLKLVHATKPDTTMYAICVASTCGRYIILLPWLRDTVTFGDQLKVIQRVVFFCDRLGWDCSRSYEDHLFDIGDKSVITLCFVVLPFKTPVLY